MGIQINIIGGIIIKMSITNKTTPPALIFLIIIIVMALSGCGYKEVQLAYYETVQKQMELHYANQHTPPNLVEIDGPDGYSIRVADPYSKREKIAINQPRNHPGYSVVGSILHSPVASIIAGGYAGSLLMKEAGDKMVNSGNTSGGDMVSSSGGDASINTPVTDSYNPNESDNRVVNSYNPDQSDNSISDSYNPDQSTRGNDID